MGFFRNLFHVLTLGIVDSDKQIEERKQYEIEKEINRREEERRVNTSCDFTNGISEEEFKSLVREVAKPIKRMRVWIDNTKVECEVRSMRGNSFWWFILDFNDFGNITGKYWWLRCDNDDSNIPSSFANELKYQIECFLRNNSYDEDEEESEEEYEEYDEDTYEEEKYIVPFSHEEWCHQNETYKCKKCGADLMLQKGFKGLDWEYFECYGCGEIFYNCEYFCQKCNAILNHQKGFHPQNDMHKCTVCGEKIFAKDIYSGEKFEDTYWYCDKCNALLNKQRGFNDKIGFWHCSECGFKNDISEDSIIKD